MPQPYTPPSGYYDLPFTWAFDCSVLSNGVDYLNNLVYIKGGYGDFVLRRIVGLSRVLNGTTGQYQIRDGSSNNIESAPVFGVSADDIGLAPELVYPNTGGIRFDLYDILLPGPPSTGQVAFQGVRRMQGSPPVNPTYNATPKSFTYTMSVDVQSPVGTLVTGRVPIDNYDFELHQLIICVATSGSLAVVSENSNGVNFVNLGLTPVNLSMPNTAGTPNLPLKIIVSGFNVTIDLATDGAGNISTTNQQLVTAFMASPGASLLLIQYLQGTEPGPTLQTYLPSTTPIGGSGSLTALGSPVSSLWIYDSNKVQIANMPVLDLFCTGGPGGYVNGAIVTPLWYPQNTQIQIDFYSQLTSGSKQVVVYLVGKKYYPC